MSFSPKNFILLNQRQHLLVSLLLIILAVSMACNLPSFLGPDSPGEVKAPGEEESSHPVPTTPPLPTPTAQPLPPTVIETDPPIGGQIHPQGALTLYFNQPMDRPSVESALSGQPSLAGSINWLDDATVVYEPDQPLLPGTSLAVSLETTARAANGLAMITPVTLQYRSSGPLQVTQMLPEPYTLDVDPTSAIVVAFNQPVIPLGADPEGLPPAFFITPSASGERKWVNTSTYIFYPEVSLIGGQKYRIEVNPSLLSTAGMPLEDAESWEFTTAAPRLLSVSPDPDSGDVRLDAAFTVAFNQPMDSASTMEAFSLVDEYLEQVTGEFAFNEDWTTMTFTPTLLTRGQDYTLTLEDSARAFGGASITAGTHSEYTTVPALRVVSTEPGYNGSVQINRGATIFFNAPLDADQALDFITISPEVPNLRTWFDGRRNALQVNGSFSPSTAYSLHIDPELPDPWGGQLGEAFSLDFTTQDLNPDLLISQGSSSIFITPGEAFIAAQVTNLDSAIVQVGGISPADFSQILTPGGFQFLQTYQPPDAERWEITFDLPRNQSQVIGFPVTPDRTPLPPGIYHFSVETNRLRYDPGPFLLVSSHVHLTYKFGATDAFIWAVDLRTNEPVVGAPVKVYDTYGGVLADGLTGSDGTFHANIETLDNPYDPTFAMVGEPGDENFGMTVSNWSAGIYGHDFNLRSSFSVPQDKTYLYTDRPIYRPGQTVYFRAVTRYTFNGRYSLPDAAALPITFYDHNGKEIRSTELAVSEFGTAHGTYNIPENAQPGYYSIRAGHQTLTYQVAEYRKPEIDLTASAAPSPAADGETITAHVNARYFFDAPAGRVPLRWSLHAMPDYFNIPGYQTGRFDDSWMLPRWARFLSMFGEHVESGEGRTNEDGTLTIEFTPELLSSADCILPCTFTFEVTMTDESGLPVSTRTTFTLHPAEFYAGIRPDLWAGSAGREIGFDVLAVDWDKQPDGAHELRAEFKKVTWSRSDEPSLYGYPTYIPEFTPVSSAEFVTAGDGKARLAFTPPEPGTYVLDVYGEGAKTQALVWVGGEGTAVWPGIPNQHIRLTADQESYLPGDTAQIFIPNPLGEDARALVTTERSEVISHEVLELDASGLTYALPLDETAAPNIYMSVTLIKPAAGGLPDFRQGYLNLPVSPVAQTLDVTLTSTPERTGPRGEVTFSLRVTDSSGAPVEGEFSLSVVDKAVLALADPYAPDILDAFYSEQPLGIRTALALAVHAQRRMEIADGLGGGGGGDESPPQIRKEFPDTAYWDAEIITDANGEAQVSMTLPDSLTTWVVDVRGLTVDTLVGQAEIELITTKDLLVRPVTPRFFTVGDHLQLAAVVHNNTEDDIDAGVSIQAAGFTLDDPGSILQDVNIPANSRVRVSWWGTVEADDKVDLIFAVSGGGHHDAAQPVWGEIPVLKYNAPQTFGTSGTLPETGDRLEIISLPRTWEVTGGELQVELAPSIAAAMVSALDVLEHYPYECIEQTVSRFLPNLVAYQAVQELGLDDPDLQARLDRTLDDGLERIASRQNEAGGWGWWQDGESDPYITSYVIFGLARAEAAGVLADRSVLDKAISYLVEDMPPPEIISATPTLDRIAFMVYALSQAGVEDVPGVDALSNVSVHLSPWARAFIAMTIETLSPGDERAATLRSNLESDAIRTATGTFWDDPNRNYLSMSTPVYSTAVAVYAIAQRDPASATLPEAVRYLVASRRPDGSWASTYDTAWAIMALTEVMKGTGELAGAFDFSATLNGTTILEGVTSEGARLNPVSASIPVGALYPDAPNGLLIEHGTGPGRLYYTTQLMVNRPVEDVKPIQQGISLVRAYQPYGIDCSSGDCPDLQSAAAGDLVNVRLSLTLENAAYHLIVEDTIPAGAEILDINLKTTEQSAASVNASNPFRDGWGWWLFHKPQVYDDRIAWAAEYLPPGTYELTYTITLNHPGEFRVIPARAWQFYFPEVQGTSAGRVLEIVE